MKMLILAALVITITINVNVDGAKVDNVFTECAENEYYDEETETCEPCTECKNSHYERQACTVFRDRVCGWCGAVNAERNQDFYRKCHWRRTHDPMEARKYEKEFRKRIMNSILKEDGRKTSEEIIDVDEHSDRRRLPPLPTDEYDDDEYADEEDVKYEVPSSEEELQGVDIIGSVVVNPIDDQNDEEVVKKPKKHDFAPISGDEFLRRDDASGEDDEDEKELEEGDVKPLEVDEEKIGQDDDLEDSGELLEGTGGHVNIVAIAIRNKKRNDQEVDGYDSNTGFTINCHFIGVLLYVVCFVLLLGAVLKRCFTSTHTRIPVMEFSDEQCAMMQRCAHHITKDKDRAIYDNDVAYV
ncbi:hypothetical protein V3C99_017351 [Haemonchus contortus]